MVEMDLTHMRDASQDLEKMATDPMGLIAEINKHHRRGIIKSVSKAPSGKQYAEVREKDGKVWNLPVSKLRKV